MMKPGVVVMTRVPLPGQTKTRMMPNLTGEECANLHQACLQDTCQMLRNLDVSPYICFAGGLADYFRQPLFAGFGVVAQEGPDLGARMLKISEELLKVHDSVLILGSDTPQLSGELMERAISSLALKDMVVGPSSDGGYYLLGLKYPHRELFYNIDWGSDRVFSQTMGAVQSLSLEAQVLEQQNDLDTWGDLVVFYREAQEQPRLQNLKVWPFLNKLMIKHQSKLQ